MAIWVHANEFLIAVVRLGRILHNWILVKWFWSSDDDEIVLI